jgi:transcription elongation factor Elf1
MTLVAQFRTSTSFVGSHCNHLRGIIMNNIRTTGRSATTFEDSNSELDGGDTNNDATGSSGLIALPPIGASSFWDTNNGRNSDAVTTNDNSDGSSSTTKINEGGIIISNHTSLVSSKFQLQYTCKICETRNKHSVTRMAYRNGVVIAVCKGCSSKHLIADNFGWNKYAGGFDYDNGETNIEMYMANRVQEAREHGLGDEKVNNLVKRVSRDVFDLESMLYTDQQMTRSIATGTDEGVMIDGDIDTGWS